MCSARTRRNTFKPSPTKLTKISVSLPGGTWTADGGGSGGKVGCGSAATGAGGGSCTDGSGTGAGGAAGLTGTKVEATLMAGIVTLSDVTMLPAVRPRLLGARVLMRTRSIVVNTKVATSQAS